MDQEPESEFTMMNEEQEHEFYPVPIQINIDDEDASMNDPFLNLLCYDNKDDDVVDGESLEDWSGSEHNWSASEEDEEDEDMKYPSYDPNVDWKLVKPILAMKFESPSQLKEMLVDYGVANGYQLVFTINDHNRMLVRCGTEETINDETGNIKKIWKCPFRLWASRVRDEDSFQIKTLNDQHTCSRQFSLGSLVTFSWIAKRYSKQIIQNPEISLRTMQQDIMTEYQCRVSLGQCARAKKRVLDDFEGGLKEHYARLSDYRAEILETNPRSTVEMVVDAMPNGENYFMYVDTFG